MEEKIVKFYCCKKPASFNKQKNGFVCNYCGRFFPGKSLLINDTCIDILPNRLKSVKKIRGRKSMFLPGSNMLSTLETGKVNLYYYDKNDATLIKTINVKKSVIKYSIKKNILITVSENGVLDFYDIENETRINSYKTDYKYSKIQISPERNGWIYCDLDKILWFSNDGKNKECLVDFSSLNIQKAQILDKIESDESQKKFVIYLKYWDNNEGKKYLNNVLINLERQDNKTDYSFMNYPIFHNYSYDFNSQVFYGTYKKCFYRDFKVPEKKIEIPVIRKFSDGGILWVEEFIDEAKNSEMISGEIIYLRFDHDFILYDVKNNKLIKWYDFGYDLIQSVDTLDKGLISVSAGLNSYLVNLEE